MPDPRMTAGREGGCKAASREVFSGGFQKNVLESAYSVASLLVTVPGSVALADKCSVRGKQRYLSQVGDDRRRSVEGSPGLELLPGPPGMALVWATAWQCLLSAGKGQSSVKP